MNHFLNSNIFYILSGISASGKSTLTNSLIEQGLPPDAIVSTDAIRKQILGSFYTSDENGMKEVLHGWNTNQNEIFSIIEKILEIRFSQKLPTIFDATNLNDETREKYVLLAKKHSINSHILIFDTDLEEIKERLSKRKERFNYSVVEKQFSIFQKDSKFPYSLIKKKDNVFIFPNLIDTQKLDIVGDTHGLLNETISLLKKNGWAYHNDMFTHPDKERKILFLGDVLDRGPQSIELLNTIINTEQNNQALFVLGNHEAKLISSYAQFLESGLVRGRSFSSSQTFLKFLSLPEKKQLKIYHYLLGSPTNYSLWINKKNNEIVHPNLKSINKYLSSEKDYHELVKNTFKIGFGHANCDYYDPYRYTKSHALYGNMEKSRNDKNSFDTDGMYENNFYNDINKYVFFRGHVVNRSKRNNIFSLEEDQAFKGNLVLLNVENYIKDVSKNSWNSKHNLFERNIMREKCEFDFNEHNKDKILLLKTLDNLVKDGLLSDGWRKDETGKKVPNPDGIKIFKYSKKVHYKRLWKTEPLLEKARGLALDQTGNIVIHPFDKVYNYGEYDVGNNLDINKEVQVIEKLNGFLGCISKHPFKNDLLVSTTGSLTSDFVGYIKDFITEDLKQKLLNYFSTNKQTLMFEVIHPEDKHIIEYEEKDHGLWLIGARGLNFHDKPVSETELDQIGKQLNMRRPYWFIDKFENVLNNMLNNEIEGYMIRDKETNETLMKIKSNYYLITKFLGRMGPKMCSLMYKKPEHFKEHHVDEEFYPIVDKIITTPQEIFENMSQVERVDFVRNIVNNLRNNVNKSHSLISCK